MEVAAVDNLNGKIGEYLRMKRVSNSLSGKCIGTILGVSQQQISRYEAGTNNFTMIFLNKYLSALEINWQEFISDIFGSDDDNIFQI